MALKFQIVVCWVVMWYMIRMLFSMKREATRLSKTLVSYPITTLCHGTEDHDLYLTNFREI